MKFVRYSGKFKDSDDRHAVQNFYSTMSDERPYGGPVCFATTGIKGFIEDLAIGGEITCMTCLTLLRERE